MTRRDFIKKTGITGLSALSLNSLALFSGLNCGPKKKQSKQPNLLFVFTDEHPGKGWSRGIPELKTPNLDRLASEGTVVSNCISNNPICVPYRATLFTGLYGHQNGFVNNHARYPLDGDLPSWSKVLKNAGYTMGYVGKWHLYPGCEGPQWANEERTKIKEPAKITPPDLRHGFDDYWVQSSNHNRPRDTYVWDVDGEYKKIDDYAPTFLTTRFLEFIEDSKDNDQPFCGVLSLLPPHPSYPGAHEKWVDYYHSIETPFWGNVPEEHRTDRNMENLKHFYAQISSVDQEFGRILDKLEEWGIADNTIVIFTSDHGDLHFAHGVKWKRYPYEESIRVPFIIRYPGKVPTNVTHDLLLGAIDLAPTLLGLTDHGDQIPKNMQGMDLSANLYGKDAAEPQSQFILYNLPEEGHYILAKQPKLRDYRGVRTKQYTYALQKDEKTGKVTPWVLYDNIADPLQMNNLINDENFASVRKKLYAEIRKHLEVVQETEWLENTPRDRSIPPGTYVPKSESKA
jgi:arylsulfatase A-like enzyme